MLFQLTVLATLSEVYCVRLNPFTGFSDNYEPLTDFSINQGAYLPNMPMLSIYPKMNDDSLNSMIGLPSLNSQMLSYPNPLLPSLPQTQFSRPPSNQNKAKSNRNNNQRPPNANPQQKQRNGPQKNRAVTLDVRGGGYKLEQKQHNGPYKAPVAASSVRNVQRHNNNNNNNNNNINNNNNNNNNNRNNGRNPGRPNNMPPRNRKPNNQRPRGPNMKNPHYNMKFETSLPSMPPNVEFVSPENVLPFHPRIYKQFLQQNKQFGSLLQNMNKMNPPKSKPQQNNRNFGGPPFPGNGRNPGKQPPSKMTRNRANQMSSSLAQSSQFPSFAPNFQSPGGQLPGPEMTSQFDFLQKQNAGKLFNPPFDANFFNQDTNFFSSFGQNSGGPAGMNQFQQQPQTGSQGNLQSPQPQGPPVSNKPSNNIYQNSKPPSFGNSNPSYQGPGGPPSVESGIPSSFGNFFGGNQGMVQYDGSNMQSNTKSPENEFQQMVRYYQQLQQQQSSAPAQQYPAPPNPLGSASFGESSQSSPSVPSYPQGQQQYPNLPVQTSPYNEYQFMQGSPFQDPQTQNSGGQSLSYGKNANAPYDDSGFPGPYQASQDQVNSQLSDIQGADQAGYTMPPFSPVDPLASAIDGSHQDIQDYYGYQQAATNHNKSPVYSSEQIAQNGGSSGMHEMSPYSDDKSSQEYDAPSKSSHSKSTSEESTAGYMTPEQLFAPHSTGLQSESKFVLSSSQGDSKSSKDTFETEAAGSSVNEQHEGSERAALHLPEEVSIYVARQTENPYLFEYTEAYDPFSAEENNKLNAESDSSKQSDSFDETESDEKINQRIREFQKLLTKAPKNSYMVQPSASTSTATTPQTTTTRVPVYKKASDAESEEMKNHKTTHSYMFQYAPAEKGNTKANPVWNAWKPNASRYHLPLPETKPQITTAAAPTTTTTTTTPAPTTAAATPSYYHEPGTPACAKHNNLTYCLQDSNYPRDDIKRAIEKNRHPLDHFLVDISASSDAIDDSLNKVFENSVPLQSTSVSYSFEGKAISPDKGEANHTAGCISNVQYAKPLRAINTAGLWKIIVNVEFEETGANYTQTVRIEECSHTSGYVATCGTETISACLQQYKLYRLLAWEPNRGFYIDAFLLPISCFCGSQQS